MALGAAARLASERRQSQLVGGVQAGGTGWRRIAGGAIGIGRTPLGKQGDRRKQAACRSLFLSKTGNRSARRRRSLPPRREIRNGRCRGLCRPHGGCEENAEVGRAASAGRVRL